MKNKKNVLLIVITILLLFIYFKNKKNNVSFFLNGEQNIVIEYGVPFNDPLFVARDGYGNNIDNNVTITGNVNSFVSGVYKINYELNYNENKINLYRIVTVKEVKADELKIVLNGEDNKYILKDTKYDEEGAYILNAITNKRFEQGNINIAGTVDTSKSGVYEIVYSYTYNGVIVSTTRKVTVIDIKYHLSTEELTTNKVKITLELDNVVDYKKTVLPDGSTKAEKIVEYEVNSNGNYSFNIILLNDQEFKKSIEINNIIKNYICSGEITSTGTRITVNPTEDIKEYNWIIGNEKIKGSNVYNSDKGINNAKVNLVFDNNKTYQVNCNITDKLIYHFKYDENNTKPYMRCNTYTQEDKVRLDALLKRAVDEAGYGTRAGVVAAARFLVGGLDYKVKYLGPKEVNSQLGRYQRIGLNIGQSGAWGCGISGWTQGMDCTNFILWAFYQNGIKTYPYSTIHSNVREVINQIKVGDLLYTPCTSSECKNAYKLDHVGIIIGIDDKYFYVAEATTGSIDAIVVSKWEKYNMPTSGKFSRVHFFNYGSDGNVTNMWIS